MRVLTVTLLLLLGGLAGCAGDEYLPVDGTSTPGESEEPAGNTTIGNGTVAPEQNVTVENLVPVINVTADVVNGTAPLLVNFTVTVDDDSENLTWAFLVAGNETLNGTEFPARFNHTFESGLWNVTVLVSDGEHVVDHLMQLNVTIGFVEPWVQSFDIDAPCTQCGLVGPTASGFLNPVQSMKGINLAWTTITSDLWGQPFRLAGANSLGGSNPELQFADTCDFGHTEIASPTAVGAVEGFVPEGAGCVFIWENYVNRPMSTITLTIDLN